MDKQIITFSANEQNLVRIGGEYHYSSNKVSYIGAHFDLGANWNGFDSVRAVWFTDRINGISTVLDGEGNCTVPTEVLRRKDRVFVNLVGSIVSNGELTDRLTTYPAVALVVDSKAKVDSTETAPVTPSQFEQFVSIVQDAVANIKDIVSTTLNADYTLTFVYSDGTSYTTPSIRGERGPQGADGADGTDGNGIASAVLNSNYTLTLTFTDGTSYTTPSIRGAQGPKGDPGDVSQAQLDAAVSDLKSDISEIEALNNVYALDASMFQMGYIDAIVGNAPVYRSSTSRFVTKEGTSFSLKKGTVIHVFTSVLERYGVNFQITKLNADGTIASVDGLFGQDYVVPSDGNYILMFRTNWTQDIPSISDYLVQVGIESNIPIVEVSNSYEKFISGEANATSFAIMDGLYQVNGNVGTPDATKLEQYTNKIKVPTSRKMIFEQTLSTAKDMFVRYVTFDAVGALVGYETPMNIVYSSSTRFEVEFTDNVEYVVFTFRSFGLTTNVSIYADNSVTKTGYTPFYSLVTPPKVPLINHRGYETLAPENSIPAFTLAGERGAFGCETDVSSTSDGVLIIMHDNTVGRTTDGSGTVTSLTYAQIQQMHIDAGANVDQYSQEELIVPTFEDFIKICRKYGMVAIIEVKLYGDLGNYVTSMLNTIYKYGMQNNVMILTINADVIKMFRAYDKNIQITLFCTSTSVVDDYKGYGNMGISIDKSTANIETLAEYAHSNDMLVSIYTAGSAAEEETLKQYFPDFITTETTLS